VGLGEYVIDRARARSRVFRAVAARRGAPRGPASVVVAVDGAYDGCVRVVVGGAFCVVVGERAVFVAVDDMYVVAVVCVGVVVFDGAVAEAEVLGLFGEQEPFQGAEVDFVKIVAASI